jgi:hypothetical protein
MLRGTFIEMSEMMASTMKPHREVPITPSSSFPNGHESKSQKNDYQKNDNPDNNMFLSNLHFLSPFFIFFTPLEIMSNYSGVPPMVGLHFVSCQHDLMPHWDF